MKLPTFLRFSMLAIYFLGHSIAAIAQQEDMEFITDFINSIAPISSTDEGPLQEDRKVQTGWIMEGNRLFFFLPGSQSASVKCVSGDCNNGEGIAEYPSVQARYEGFFKDSYPDSTGIVTNKNGIRLNTTMDMGEMTGWQMFELDTRPYESLGFNAFAARINDVKNMYWPTYQAYYTGRVNGLLKPNNADNSYVTTKKFKGRIGYLRDDGTVSTFIGELDYNDFYVFDGKLTPDFKMIRGKFVNKVNGMSIEPKFAEDGSGKIYYHHVTIRKGDTIYVGQTNQKFQPHGEGYFMVKGTDIEMNGKFDHGVFIDPYQKHEEAFASKQTSNAVRQAMVSSIDKMLGVSGFRGYLYKGSPAGLFQLKATNFLESTPEIYVFNLSETPQDLCMKSVKDGLKGRMQPETCFKLAPTFHLSGNEVTLNKAGVHKITLSNVEVNQTYNVTINGAAAGTYYIVVKY